MGCDQAIALLRAHEHELRCAGVEHLSLFGSTSRNEAGPDSDVALLAVFDASKRLSLLDVAGIELRLSRLLSAPVELVEEGSLKPRVQAEAASEAVRAF